MATARPSIKGQNARVRLPQIMAALEKAHPDAKLDLDFKNPLELLIALILAAQARDDLVNQITAEVFRRYRRAEDYAGATQEQMEQEIGKINFFRNKSRAIRNCCRAIMDRFAGRVPDTLDDLLSLPGVGRKTANILLGNAFGQTVIGVDTHVMRLSQRLGFTKNTDADKIEADLTPLVPAKQRVRFCHLLQYHGRRICGARKPNCPGCVIRSLCPYPAKTQV